MDELETLVFNIKNKDMEALEKIMLDMEKEFYRIGRFRLHNDEDVNDAIQETAINVYRSIHKLRNPQFLKTWITRIFINKCNEIYKENKKDLKLYKKVKKTIDLTEIDVSNLVKVESKIELERVLNKLSYNERWCIILSYNNYTINEISEILNINPNTVKSKIARTREKIRMYCK